MSEVDWLKTFVLFVPLQLTILTIAIARSAKEYMIFNFLTGCQFSATQTYIELHDGPNHLTILVGIHFSYVAKNGTASIIKPLLTTS
jgi:hypothetical protein